MGEIKMFRENSEQFTPDAMIKYAEQIGVRYIDIMVAQSRLETSNYHSNIFCNSRNLFGMKKARIRPTTAIGEQYGHAYYMNWKQSVSDYKLWQDALPKRINTRREYIAYIKNNYAEDKNYINKLKQML